MQRKILVCLLMYFLLVLSEGWSTSMIEGEEADLSGKELKELNPSSPERMVGYEEEGGVQIINDSSIVSDLTPSAAQTEGSLRDNKPMENQYLLGPIDPHDFSDLALVEDPEEWPYRANVKLIISFSDGDQGACSGVLIDPKYVLTAGHCVWGGIEGDWADSIDIIPGYESFNEPWGHSIAYSSGLFSWDGWVYDQNNDDDVGLIYFDRPIGAITGWFSYGYNEDPSFYTNNIFYNPGYPAASPYDGQRMYSWSGRFDGTDFFGFWYGNEVWVNSIPKQGQSGSGAYHITGDSRTVYAVYSNWELNRGNYPRITSTKYNHIRDLIQSNTPSSADLIPLNVRTTPQSIRAGEQLSSLSYMIHNYSSASWTMNAVQVDVYLSPDRDITTDDTLISTHMILGSILPKKSELISTQILPTIPITTSLDRFNNKYWIGVMLNCSDYNTANNITSEHDVSMIEVDFPLTSTTTTTLPKPITTTIPRIITTSITIDDDCPPELIYGKYSKETELLRYFRDNLLNQTPEGEIIIQLYYTWSPLLVRIIEEDETFKEEVRALIDEILPIIEGMME